MKAKNNNTKFKKLTSRKATLIYFVFAALWILGSGQLVEFSTQDPTLRAQIELAKGMLFVFFTSGLLYILLSLWGYQAEVAANRRKPTRPFNSIRVAVLFTCLVLIVPLLGWVLSKHYEPEIEQRAYENLHVVNQLKADQLENWLNERNADALTISDRSTEFVRSVQHMVKNADATSSAYVRGKLASYKVSYQYDSLLVVDEALHVLLAVGENAAVETELADLIARVFRQGIMQNTDLYRSLDGQIHMDWVTPIFDVTTQDKSIIAVVVLRTSPNQFLYPLIQSWPGVSDTAETMLVRRDGDAVFYLNELKRRSRTALTLQLPLSSKDLPAAIAIQGNQPGTVQGKNYLGETVLSAYQPIAGSDWYLVTNINRDEVFHDLIEGLLIVTLMAFSFVIIISLALLLLWRQQFRLQQLQVDANRAEADRLLNHFFTMPFVGMVVISPEDKHITQCNDYLCEITGHAKQELVGHSYFKFVHHEDVMADMAEFARVLNSEITGYVMEKRFLRKDGQVIHAVVDTKCVRKDDGTVDYLFATAEDITARKANEARIQRLTQLYAALSDCNQMIVRCDSEQALFSAICQTAVVSGGMKMAWIGMIDAESSMVMPVASFGDDIGYLKDIQISCDANHAYGQGPTGIAIRQNQPFWCQDFKNDPLTSKWRERSQGSWASSATVPILRGGMVVGAMNMYSGVKDAFDTDAKNLLIEMAVDIGFALDNFDKEAKRVSAESRLIESETKFHLLFDQNLDGLLIIDGHEIKECNPAALNMMGCTAEHIIHAPAWSFSPAKQPDGMASEEKMKEMLDVARSQGRRRFEWMYRRLNGEDFPVEVTMVTINLNGKQVFYTTWRDISEQKYAEARIRHLAQYDALTSLPNRTLLTDRVNQAINIAERNQQKISLMFFDLDRFKNVNDTLGHGVGDELLMQVSRRLQGVIREQDSVARIGGDEFVLMLLNTAADGAARVAEKIMHVISEPYDIDPHEISITSSIGIALYPDDGRDFEGLLKSADIAMYRAKQAGRNNYHFFTAKMQEDSVRSMQLTSAMRHAVDLDQLTLNYQPQISLKDDTIIGVEALLRWQHPQFGLVSPAEFIPAAEDSGEILRIGEWVLRQAVRQLKQWQDQGMSSLVMAVNLSAVQFRHPHLPDLIEVLLEDEGLKPEYLELELTESAAMDNPVAMIAMMARLSELGVKMSIDDFGTGYSSLSYLKRFTVSKLKIDQSFVHDIMTDADDRAIVKTIVLLSKSLGIKTIAEGVETAEQLAFLKQCKCDEIQGYLISKPLKAEDFVAFYQQHQLK
jgi:diguanylate cyclase (GGDEF)-like protein/PAS domain S-box-containing protein